MVHKSADDKTLELLSRQLGHLPEPGWRPNNQGTPVEAWEGLLLADQASLPARALSEALYLCGCLCDGVPILGPFCNLLASVRRCVGRILCGCLSCCLGPALPFLHRRRRVAALHLPSSGVVGSLPPKPGPGLRSLTSMVLYDNALHGPLPKSISRFRHLQSLNLSSNRLTGKLPSSLGYLYSLRLLDLHGNAFDGPLDDQLKRIRLYMIRGLTHVSLAENKFDGPFPDSFLHMPWLIELHLSGLRLSGPIPHCSRLKRLTVLDLSFNVFTGPVPDFGHPLHHGDMLRRLGAHRPLPRKKGPPVATAPGGGVTGGGDKPPSGRPGAVGAAAAVPARAPAGKQAPGTKKEAHKQLKDERARVNAGGADHVAKVVIAAESQAVVVLDTTNESTLTFVAPHHAAKPANPAKAKSGHPLSKFGKAPPGPTQATVGMEVAVAASRFKTLLAKKHRAEDDAEKEAAAEAADRAAGHGGGQGAGHGRKQKKEPPVPLASLRSLMLTRNQLTGPLPPGLGRLTTLVRLDLGTNKLTSIGDVDWSHLTRLEHLDVSRNRLEGKIPHGLVSLAGLRSLRLENNKLKGPVPDVVSRLQSLDLIDFSGNPLLDLRDVTREWMASVLKKTTISRI